MNSNNKGFSLISVMLAAAVSFIIISAMTSHMISTARLTSHLQSKLESLDLKQELALAMTNNLKCDASFAGLAGINLGNATIGDYTDITSAISGANPLTNSLKAIKDSYTNNNQYITLTSFRLFKPYKKSDGITSNDGLSPPLKQYEFHLKVVVQEKSGLGLALNVDGPKVNLNITTGTTVDADACGTAALGSGVINGWMMNTSAPGIGAQVCPPGTYLCGMRVDPANWDNSPSDYNFGIACCNF